MANAARKALRKLRSGSETERAMEDLIECGKTAVTVVTRELGLQPPSSLFTATLIRVLGRLARINPYWIDSKVVTTVYTQTQRFVPPGVVVHDRNGWIVTNLERLGTQVERSRYRLDDRGIQAAEAAMRRASRGVDNRFVALADVLDGDLDGNPQLKSQYVQRVADFLAHSVATNHRDLALSTCQILGCFGPMAGVAVPSILELLDLETSGSQFEIEHIYALLETLERIGHASHAALPRIVELINLETESLIREDGLMIRVMDALASIGVDNKEVRKMLHQACTSTAGVIQTHARDTLWKLCIDEEV
jgi:hypothetical protein